MATYSALKEEWASILRARFDGDELLDLVEVAAVYGYDDSKKAKAELHDVPAYLFGEKSNKRKYAVKDIAANLACRAVVPGSIGARGR